MSASNSYLLQLDIGSSVTSGVSALLFDIVLLGLIKAESQILCSIANIYLMYDRREAISPTTSRLGFLTGSPVGNLNLTRCFSLLIALATGAAIVLGFSINGKTVSGFETVTYRSVLVSSRSPLALNYEKEFARELTEDGNNITKVSRRLRALFDFYTCTVSNFTHTIEYSTAFQDLSLDDTLVDMHNRLEGGECVTQDRFEKEMIMRRFPMQAPTGHFQCEFRDLKVETSSGKRLGYATFSPASQCELNISRLVCITNVGTTCAGAGTLKGLNGSEAFLVTVPDINFPARTSSGRLPEMGSLELYERVSATASLVTQVFGDSPAYFLSGLSTVSVKNNIQLRRMMRRRQVSEIDLRFAIPSTAFMTSVALLLAVAALHFWISRVYRKGRCYYKSFSTVQDVLTLADGEEMSKFQSAHGDHRFIGVRTEAPEVGVLNEFDSNRGIWDESDIH